MAKAKKTPAYVKKAIEWLEKNAPDGEQIAFINDQEAAHLKSMGGSGKEAVDGVRSYAKGEGPEFGSADIDAIGWGNDPAAGQGVSMDIGQSLGDMPGFSSAESRGPDFPGGVAGDWGGPDIAGIRRSQEDAANREFLNELRRRAAAGEFDEAGRTADQEAAFTLEGGAEAQRQALAKSNILDIPTRPDAPTLETPTLTAGQDELISPQGLGVAMAPTIDPVQTVDPTGLSPDAPTRVPAATTTAAQVADTGQAQAATQVAPTQVIGDIQEAIPTEELAQAATADLDERATVKFQLEQITSTIKDVEALPS